MALTNNYIIEDIENYYQDDYKVELFNLFEPNYSFNFFQDIYFNHPNIIDKPNIYNTITPNSNEHNNNNNNNNTENQKNSNKNEITLKKKLKTDKTREKKEKDIFLLKKKRKTHNKYDWDNIKRKIQVHYFKFLVEFVNKAILEILKEYNKGFDKKISTENIQFKKISYDFAKKIDSESFHLLKTKKLKDILIENTSKKFRNFNNKDIYNNIINLNKNVNNILNNYYLELFDVFYYQKDNINLSKYGIDLVISLDGIERFQEFLKSQKENEPNFDLYKQRIEQSIYKEFLCSNPQKFLVERSTKI
jgi:hypothetical protein